MRSYVLRPLYSGFLRATEDFPDRPAVVAENITVSYRQLRERAFSVASTIQAADPEGSTPLTAVFAYRSPTAFVGVLGSLLAGHGYVPLNRTFPIERSQAMLDRSECSSLIVDEGSLPQLNKLLEAVKRPVVVLVPDLADVATYAEQWPNHKFLGTNDLKPSDLWREPTLEIDSIAYLLFTSGSTGIPKGVAVAQRNVTAFLDYMVDRYQITENDRLSQMFDMTFDLSVFDMFVAWERGACVCCPSQKTLIKPGKFINDSQLTMWFSVPSTAVFMKQLGMLKAGQYPSLRFSLFCGEPLPVSSATAWLAAAPNSTVENLYGPTELTIACTLYRWDPEKSASESELGIVPIGYPYPDMNVLVADENLREVPPGQEGELLMNGSQMSLGYWRDPAKTAAAFVTGPGSGEIYYRTGDRVRRPLNNGPLTHLGRIDSQVKIFGHRVELGEVESKVRDACGLDGVVAVGWPKTASGFGGVEAFIEGQEAPLDKLRQAVAAELPEYMIPRRFHFMERLPRNANNKYDRKAMQKLLEEGL
jgi:amino acid adenylation domain-containing protein